MSAARAVALLASALLVFSLPAQAAPPGPPPPQDLRVEGGDDRWRAVNSFRVKWDQPPASANVTGSRYRILRMDGSVALGPTLKGDPNPWIDLSVPGRGEFTVEVSLVDRNSTVGPPASVRLRFDDSRPGPAAVLPMPAWIGRAGLPAAIRLAPPSPPHPPAGIGGYAVSIDGSPYSSPCVGNLVCTDAEIDLRGGAGDSTFRVDELPEGTSHLHVVAVSGSGVRSATVRHALLRVDKTDPATRLEGLPSGWSNGPVHLVARATDALSGMEDLGGLSVQPFTAIRVDGGMPRVAAGDAVSASLFESGVHLVEHYARDAAGNVNDGATANGRANRLPAADVVRIDREPPTVSFAPFQDPLDPERIEARVSDPLSGPAASRGWIGVRAAGSGDPFQPLPTERSAGGLLTARWSSDDFPAGAYEFRATGYDAAGNSASTTERSGGGGMVLTSPLKTPTVLEAGFGAERLVWHRCDRRQGRRRCRRETISSFARRPLRRVLPYGRGAIFGGRLTGAGAPAGPGLPIEVVERFDRGPEATERVTPVTTDAAGRFSMRLGPGPGREVLARFGGTRTLSRAGSVPVRLDVRSRVRLRVSAATAAIGGRPVIFSGRVFAGRGEIPPVGKAVALQFRLPGMGWTEFRTIRTDRAGRFRHAYRFADDDSRGVRFQFRAFATPEPGWPYVPAGSRPVFVEGK